MKSRNNKWQKSIKSDTALEIVSDAAISSVGIANGKMIPLIIINTEQNVEIAKNIALHENFNQGHVNTVWGKSSDGKYAVIIFTFIDPAPMNFCVLFDVVHQGILIDSIIYTQLLYIQPGRVNDRLKNTMNNPRLLVEIPSQNFADEWDKLYKSEMTKYYMRQKYSKREALEIAVRTREEWANIRNFRMK